jgi:hypothetical protein
MMNTRKFKTILKVKERTSGHPPALFNNGEDLWLLLVALFFHGLAVCPAFAFAFAIILAFG